MSRMYRYARMFIHKKKSMLRMPSQLSRQHLLRRRPPHQMPFVLLREKITCITLLRVCMTMEDTRKLGQLMVSVLIDLDAVVRMMEKLQYISTVTHM
jgi:hypothetical protein